MKFFKYSKYICLLLIFICVLSFVGCKKKPAGKPSEEEKEYTISLEQQMICNEEYEISIDTDDFTVDIDDTGIIEHVGGKTVKAINEGSTSITIKAGKTVFNQTIEVKDELRTNIETKMLCNSLIELEVSYASIGKINLNDVKVDIENTKVIRYAEGCLTSLKLGTTTITVTTDKFEKVYEVEVIDKLYLNVADKMTNKSTLKVECTNAQGKKMTDAVLTSSNPEVVRVNSLTEIEALSEGVATLTLVWNGMEVSKEIEVVRGFYFTYNSVLKIDQSTSVSIVSTNDEEITDFTLRSSDESILQIVEGKKIQAISNGSALIYVDIPGYDTQEIMVTCPKISISGSTKMVRGGIQSLKVSFNPSNFSEEYSIVIENPAILEVISDTKIKALEPGTTKIFIETISGFTAEFEVTVAEKYYSISFDLSEEDEALMPEGYIDEHKKFALPDLPLSLPVLEKDMKSFLGWSINGVGSIDNIDDLSFVIPEGTNYNVSLEAVWGDSRIELYHENEQIVEPGKTINLVTETFMIAKNIDKNKLTWESENDNIATVENGVVTGVSDGFTLIKVKLTDYPKINTTIGVTVMSGINELDDILQYFIDNAIDTIIAKNIVVTGYQFVYQHRLLSSVTNYLFEDFVVNNDVYPIPSTNSNRPGVVYPKYYITVHDTASSASSATAKAHAQYVLDGGGGTSWHYSVGNDGIYHQIPDNENAYHAGDGGRPYQLYNSGIKATTKYPIVTISTDGYYELNGEKSNVLAPRNDNNEILTTKDINDEGIRVVIQDGVYFIGNTYYNSTYHYIANAGGNNNSIGMETMVNQGSDLYYTWQKTAKLVAHLMQDNNLSIDDVKPHHFFSGKNCPETMRDNGLWPNFIKLVQFEYDMLTKYSDYTISFESHDLEYLNALGRVIKQDKYTKTVSYTITVSKNGVSKSVTLSTNIPGTIGLKPIN
ncbi:MAG: N-acetylmuramoyl-L-alanine amidase [Bacilli bacterium]